MSVDTDSRTGVPLAAGGVRGWVRVPLIVVGVVTLLLIGAAGGLLIARSGPAAPATPVSGSVDVGFLQDMSVHHLQAVQMASLARDHSAEPAVRALAFDIEATQTGQVGMMQGWLDLWNVPGLPTRGHMAWMTGAGHHHEDGGPVATMPGMATSGELEALRAARGPALDVLFLQLMLRHHEGGAEMLHSGAEHATVPQVQNLASQMLSSQAAESGYLRQLLAERGAQPLPL